MARLAVTTVTIVTQESGGSIGRESRDAKHERRSALPGYMIAHSSAYMETLFETIRAFARCPSIVVQARELLMTALTRYFRYTH